MTYDLVILLAIYLYLFTNGKPEYGEMWCLSNNYFYVNNDVTTIIFPSDHALNNAPCQVDMQLQDN
jgi:hypothetical protein